MSGRTRSRHLTVLAAVLPVAILSLGLASGAPAKPPAVPTTSCTGPLGATTVTGNLAAGAGCVLNGTTVTGDVAVQPGGSLTWTNATVAGGVTAQGATKVFLQGGSVGGDVVVNGGLPCVAVGANSVGGSVTIENTSGDATASCFDSSFVDVAAGSIAGGVTISGNTFSSSNESLMGVVLNPGSTIANGVTISGNSLSGAGVNEIAVIGSGETTAAAISGGLDIQHNSTGGSNVNANGIVAGDLTVSGDTKVTDNTASGSSGTDAVAIESMSVMGNLLFQRNSASGPAGATVGVVVDGTTTSLNLNCAGNAPSPTTLGNANTTKNANGQCASMPNLFG